MPEQIHCPECSATLRVPETLLGKKVKCPKCQTTFTAELEAPAEPDEGIVNEPVPSGARRRPLPPEDVEDEPPYEDEDEDQPRRGRRRGRRSGLAESMVAGPAIALMVVGGLDIALHVLDVIMRIVGVGLLASASAQRGGAAPANAAGMAGGIFGDVFALIWSILIILGAVKMKSLSSYGLAMTACILAIIPCHGCCFLGIPFGIWGLVILNKPEVKDTFS